MLVMKGIVKQFPGVRALDGVDLDVRAGEVHCLLGQNGAGKSTLIKVLAGVHQPDEGTISFNGAEVRPGSPIDAIKLGFATIYQELDLVDGLSVAENIFLGHEHAHLGFVNRAAGRRAAREVLERLGHPEIRPSVEVGRLSPAAKQVVSMARALSHEARLIIMDEPSAALAHDEVANLFRIIRELTAQGVAVVYISHRLEEIREIGDRVTVLKDGRTVAVGLPARDTPTTQIVSLMTGRNVEYVFPPRGGRKLGEEVLRVEGLSSPGVFEDVSFAVRAGEIVGLAGLVGSGRSEILEAVYGARPATGRVLLDGRQVRRGVVGTVRSGMGLAPEERKAQALLLDQSVTANITLGSLPGFARFGWIDRKRERDEARRLSELLSIRPPIPNARSEPFPAATSRRPCSPAGCSAGASCSCSTSPPAAWTWEPGPSCTRSSTTWPSRASACCWSPARCPRCWAWPTACWCCGKGPSSTRERQPSWTSTAYWT